jgi:hypothetical protein
MSEIVRVILFLAIFVFFRDLRVLLFKTSEIGRWQVAFFYSLLWGGLFFLVVILFLEQSYFYPFGILLFFVNFLIALPVVYFAYPYFSKIREKNNL